MTMQLPPPTSHGVILTSTICTMHEDFIAGGTKRTNDDDDDKSKTAVLTHDD